jgi:site-specific recombinase XerD
VVTRGLVFVARVEHLTLLEPLEYAPLQAAVDAFLLSKEAARCTPRTLEHYGYTLGAFLEFLQCAAVISLWEIAREYIRRYLVNLQRQGLRDTTQHTHASGIKAWLNWLVAEGELDVSPMCRVALPKLEKRIPPPFHPDEVRWLLAACDRKTSLGLRNHAIVLGLLDSGLRLAEFASGQRPGPPRPAGWLWPATQTPTIHSGG